MSYLGGFMDGLGDARQQNDRDVRLQMDMETRRAALQNDAMANARADERIGMERERAIRDARDSDLNFREKQGAAERAQKVRLGIEQAFRTHLGEREEVAPDGTKRMVKPDPSDLKVQTSLFSDVIRVKAENGAMDPEEMKQLYAYRKEVEKDGSLQAFKQLLAGDGSGVAAKLKDYGLDPRSVRLDRQRDPKTGMISSRLVGQGAQGPFEMSLTPLMMALGLPDVDIDKTDNDRALTGARIRQSDASADASLRTARAAESRAAAYGEFQRARAGALGGGAGPGAKVDFNEKESRDFQTALNQSKPAAPKVASVLGQESVDEPGREFLRDAGLSYFRREVAGGRRPSIQETMSKAQSALAVVNDESTKLLPTARFVIDPTTRSPRLVSGDVQGAVPFNRVPPEQRLSAFDQVRRMHIEQKRQEVLRRRQAEEQKRRQRAIDLDDDDE